MQDTMVNKKVALDLLQRLDVLIVAGQGRKHKTQRLEFCRNLHARFPFFPSSEYFGRL